MEEDAGVGVATKKQTVGLPDQIVILSYRFLTLAAICATVVLMVYFGVTRTVEVASGKDTNIAVFYKAILNFDLKFVVSMALNGSLVYLWYRERKLRKTTVSREHRRLELLEKREDPKRSSSDLVE